MTKNSAQVSPSHAQTLKAKHCRELSYRITVPAEHFDLKRFAEAIGSSAESRGWDSVLRRAKDPNAADYHLHVYWRTHYEDRSKVQLQVDFHTWSPESKKAHDEPYAENFFEWVGQFFEGSSVTAHIHAEFDYPVERWHSKIMALPIRVPYGERGAVIEGLAINLPEQPGGVRDVWLERGTKSLTLQLFADRPLQFRTFTPHNDVDVFVAVSKTLVEEKEI